MDTPYDLEELPPKRDCVDPQDLVDFIEKDCDRIMSRINGGGNYLEGSSKYKSETICLLTTLESFKNQYLKICHIMYDRFKDIKIKSIRFESCMYGDCGIRFGTGFFVIEY